MQIQDLKGSVSFVVATLNQTKADLKSAATNVGNHAAPTTKAKIDAAVADIEKHQAEMESELQALQDVTSS